MKKKNRLSFNVLLMILLSFAVLTTVSYSWFNAEVNLGGNTIETASLNYEAYGYNKDGTLVSTILNEGQTSTATNVNSPLFSSGSFVPGNSSTVYVSIKSNASIDLEYNLNIIARGYSSGELNFTELGGYWYRITDITSKVTTLAAYISANGSATESGTLLNMNVMNTSSTFGTIQTSDTSKTKYYRIDFGVNSNATSSQYTTNRIELFANVEVDQNKNTNNNQSMGKEFKISDSISLISAIENASSLDTLYFLNNVEYVGDLIIKKCLNMNLSGKTLTVTGNIIYNYTLNSSLKINLSGNGIINVLSSNGVDGNLIFDTPNAQVEVFGTNSKGKLVVENNIIVSCSNEDGKMGCSLSGITAVKPNGENATIVLKSNTTLSVGDVAVIDTIKTYDNTMNVKVVNYGTINNITFSNMKSSSQTASPQIYIQNYGTINSIVLPSWSVKFNLGTNGTNTGNTRVSNSFGAKITDVSGSTSFKKTDILEVSSTIFVESVDGTLNNLRILFKNKTNSTTTIQGLLDEYFKNLGYTSSSALKQRYAAITKLEIDAVEGKCFASTDLTFLNSTSLSGLKTLDLQDANFTNNTLPKSFYTRAYLTELILPKNLIRIEGSAFGSNVKIMSLNIPRSVVTLGENALINISYAVFESEVPPKIDVKGTIGSRYNFVPEESVEAYDEALTEVPPNNWTNYPMAFYPYATLADDGIHFVRLLGDGTYELVVADSKDFQTKIASSDYVIGNDIKINDIAITISTIGRCAYLNFRISGLNVTFTPSVHTIRYRSFDNASFSNIDFSYVQTFEDYCGRGIDISGIMKFTNCGPVLGEYTFTESGIAKIDTGTVPEIGHSAFSACSVTDMSCPNLVVLGNTAIYRCHNLINLYTPKVEYISTNGISEHNRLYEINLPSVKEIGYGVFNKCPSLVSLYLGPNLVSVSSDAIIEGTTTLEYVFIETTTYVKVPFLIDGRVTAGKIYVTPGAYDGFYSALTSSNKANLLEFGINRVGTCIKEIYYNNKLVVNYNVGEYVVNVEKEGVTIVSYNVTSIPSSYQIPKTLEVNGEVLPVVGIGRNVFKNKAVNPTSLNNVETIGDYAFYNCDSFVNLNAPNLKTVGQYAFAECNKLATANIPMVTHWSAYMFSNCPKLTKIVSECKFTSEATAINGTTTAVTNITINYDVASSSNLPATTVFDGLKSKCANVVLYVKANSLSIFNADSVFKTLTLKTIEQSVSDANGNTYYVSSITINGSACYQIDYIVGNGTALIIPATYSSVNIVCSKPNVFDGITASSITIPANYIYINDREFSNVKNLASISVNSSNAKLTSVDGVLYTKDMTELLCYPNSKSDTSYTVNSSAKVIRNSAFENVNTLTKVIFNAGISYIGVDAFKNSSVTTFDFSSTTVPYIMGASAFGTKVTSILVPSALLSVYQMSNNFRMYSHYIQGK